MRLGLWNLEDLPTGTRGFRKISRTLSFFELFPLNRYKVRIFLQKSLHLDKICRDLALI
jgi:hypothetical protein